MLTPTKHSNPDRTVVAAATSALRAVRRTRVVGYDELKAVVDADTKSADYLFTPAISLLYLLGLVSYHPVNDTFEFVGRR